LETCRGMVASASEASHRLALFDATACVGRLFVL
jgi:hypothetical protein